MGAKTSRCKPCACFPAHSFGESSVSSSGPPSLQKIPEAPRPAAVHADGSWHTAASAPPRESSSDALFFSFTDGDIERALSDSGTWSVRRWPTTSSSRPPLDRRSSSLRAAEGTPEIGRARSNSEPRVIKDEDEDKCESFLGKSVPGTTRESAASRISVSPRLAQKQPRQNANLVTQYAWLQELFDMIVAGRALGAGRDTVRNEAATPLLVVAGTCPNSMSGMQAICFFRLESGIVDFWWVKPRRGDPHRLERSTLDRHSSGPFKNEPGSRIRQVYDVLAERIAGKRNAGDFTFGIGKDRAYVEDLALGPPHEKTMLPYLMWQESWSSSMARHKFIAGKLCYHKPSNPDSFYSRQWQMSAGNIFIAPRDEEEFVPSLLPPEAFQRMYNMD